MKCIDPSLRVFMLVVVVIAVGAVYTFFVVTKPSTSLPSAARKTIVFFLQVCEWQRVLGI